MYRLSKLLHLNSSFPSSKLFSINNERNFINWRLKYTGENKPNKKQVHKAVSYHGNKQGHIQEPRKMEKKRENAEQMKQEQNRETMKFKRPKNNPI